MNAVKGSVRKPSGSSGFLRLISNASSMVGSSALNSGLGFVYWVLAAKIYANQPAVVGLTTALASLMIGLSSLSMLGLGNTLVGELPQMQRDRGRLFAAALIASGLTGLLIGLLAVLFVPLVSSEFAPLRSHWPLAVMFVGGVALTATGQVLDEALMGLLRGKWQLWRNAIFAVLKLGLLFALGLAGSGLMNLTGPSAGGLIVIGSSVVSSNTLVSSSLVSMVQMGMLGSQTSNLFATWVLALGASFVLLAWTMRAQGVNVLPRPDFVRLWATRRIALGHHAINLADLGTGSILPVMVTAMFGAKINASFYNAWMLTGFGFVVPYALAMVLHAMSAADIKALATRLRSSLGISSLIVGAYGLVLFFGAHLILGVFGKNYLGAASSLQILSLALLPVVIKTHYMTLGRIRNQLSSIARYAAVGTILELILAVIGAQLAGLSGLCLGYVIALYLEAAYAGRHVYLTAFPPAVALFATDAEAKP
jgi:O-antigen/teichoic acid export membrane protein